VGAIKVVIEEDDMDTLPSRADLKKLLLQGVSDELTAALSQNPVVPPTSTLAPPPLNMMKEH
jgi:hypothetical protein